VIAIIDYICRFIYLFVGPGIGLIEIVTRNLQQVSLPRLLRIYEISFIIIKNINE
jgi:hypothetical protein